MIPRAKGVWTKKPVRAAEGGREGGWPKPTVLPSATVSLLIACSGVCLFLAIFPPFYGPILTCCLDQY